jgi:hypothetical protein
MWQTIYLAYAIKMFVALAHSASSGWIQTLELGIMNQLPLTKNITKFNEVFVSGSGAVVECLVLYSQHFIFFVAYEQAQ